MITRPISRPISRPVVRRIDTPELGQSPYQRLSADMTEYGEFALTADMTELNGKPFTVDATRLPRIEA